MAGMNFKVSRLMLTLRQRKWILSFLFFFTVVSINIAGLFMPRKYQASGTMKLNDSQVTNAADSDGANMNPTSDLVTISPLITSFQFLDRVATQLGMGAQYPQASPEYNKLIEKMRKNLDLQVNYDTHLIIISYTAEDPDEAYKVCEKIISIYTSHIVTDYEDSAKQRVEFFVQKLSGDKGQLTQAEEEIANYQREYPDSISEIQDAKVNQRTKLFDALEDARRTYSGLQDALTMYNKLLATTPKTLSSKSSTQSIQQDHNELRQLQAQRREMDVKLKSLAENFTEINPQVIEARKNLAMIDDQIKTLNEQTSTTEPVAPTATTESTDNPRYQMIEDKINQDAVSLGNTSHTITSLANQLMGLEGQLSKIPEYRREMNRREAARELVANQVTNTMKQLDEAKTRVVASTLGQGPTFERFENPRKPTEPYSPKPVRIAAVSVAMAGMLVAGIVYLLTMMDSVIRDVSEARLLLHMPILGVVQNIVTDVEATTLRRRRLRRSMSVALGIVLVIAIIAVAVLFFREPIARNFEKLTILFDRIKDAIHH